VQGDVVGVAGEEVVGAGLEGEERLQRRPAYLPGLHPPRGVVPQRSQHMERIGLGRGHFGYSDSLHPRERLLNR